MAGTPKQQAALAKLWIERGQRPLWKDFPRYWTAFNALYNTGKKANEPEEDAIDRTIRTFFDEPAAAACLKDVDKTSIRSLIHIPPGDDRYQPGHPKFREKGQRRVRQFTTPKSAVDRLSALMRVVYQVRCNTIHGSKRPHVIRDQQLVEASTPIVKVVVRHLSAIMAQMP